MNRISTESSIGRVVLSLGAVLLAAGTLSAQSPHPDFSGFWEPKYTGGSGAFIDVFGRVDRAPLVPGLPPMQRPSGEHPAYGAKDPVDGSACRVLAFPFFTIENVDVVDATHIVVGNDNNLPFSSSRDPVRADDNELVLLEAGALLRAR